MEGVVAKRLDSTYQPGRRSDAWRKVKTTQGQELVVGGWLPGAGRLDGRLGSLLVGYYDDGALRYAGRVGFGSRRAQAQRARSEARAARARHEPVREDAEAARPALGRARARRRGGLPELDQRGDPARAALPGVARRQGRRPRWCARSGRARGDAAGGPPGRAGARSRRPDRASCRCAPSPSTSGRCSGEVNDTISSSPIVSKPKRSAARAPSLA